MKKILLTLVLLVGIIFGLFAQNLTYQAVVRDNNQQLVVNTAVKATVTIEFTSGDPYQAEVNGSTNIHGLLSIEFGDATLKGRDWTSATIAVKVVKASDENVVYVNDDARPVSAVPYALSVDGQSIQNYLTANNYVDLAKLKDTLSAYPTTAVMDGRHYLRSDSAVITTMQSDIAGLKAGQFDCNKVKDCIKDTLDQYTPTNDLCNVLKDCQFSEQTLAELLQGLTDQISDLKEQVDSLSTLPHGDGDTPTAFTCGTDKVKDVDNNEYNTVQIGSQCWMAQNLRTNVDGSVYPKKNSGTEELDEAEQVTYGRLYTWAAMMNSATSTNYPASGDKVQGICPAGWHVPSDAEWDTLTKYVYNSTDPNYKCSGCLSSGWEQSTNCIAKALATTTGWSSSSDSGCNAGNSGEKSNLTGFAAVPAGDCFIGSFTYFGSYAYFWSATENEDDNNTAWYRSLGSLSFSVNRSGGLKITGYSVRCLRDAGIGGTPGENETGGTTPSTPATMSCDDVMNCLGDTLGKLNNKIEAQGQTITTQGNTIDSLAHIVDSLSNLSHGGGDTPTTFTCGTDKVKDIQNNEYPTVKIGSQCWMAQNLRTNVDGSVYPQNSGVTVTGEDTVTYGRLYTWAAMMKNAPSTNYPAVSTDTIVHGICPAGWHVPSEAEWDTLTYYVYNSTEPDYKCSGCSTTVWKQSTECIAKALATTTGWSSNTSEGCNAGNTGGKSNLTGFSAVPAGRCFPSGFGGFGVDVSFWSATEVKSSNTNAWCRYLNSAASDVKRNNGSKSTGFSVRCLRDAGIGGTPGENETGGTTPSAPATMSCDDVMRCMGDTLGRLNDKIVAQGQTITTQGLTIENLSNTVTEQNQTITEQGNTIDSLAHLVDSLSQLSHGGETPTAFTCGTDKVKDVQDNEYNTVQIGNQCWMAQNLRTNVGGGVYPKYPNSHTKAGQMVDDSLLYGRLYTWAAMMKNAPSTNYPAVSTDTIVHGICPTGWHVPSDAEWDTLTTYVNSVAEYKCGGTNKAIANALSSSTGWQSPSVCGAGHKSTTLNLTGFAAVPAGYWFSGGFTSFGFGADFWSATQYDGNNAKARYRFLNSNDSYVYGDRVDKVRGLSVRCLRDAE